MPEPGADLNKAVVEPALIQRVVQFRGDNENPVRHITLRGLWIAHGDSTYFEPYSPAGMGDYTIHRGGAVFLEGAEDITVDRCSLEGNSGNGFYVNWHARRVKLTNSRVVDVGENGICFTGKDNYRTDKRTKCPHCGFDHWWGWDPLSDNDIPMDCEAVNNVVHDVGVFAKQCGGVFIANALRIRIAHNHIYNCPRAGINVNNGVYGGHVFENNDLHDTVRETSDHGPFNAYGRDHYWCQYVNHHGAAPEGQTPHHGDRRHDFGPFEEIAKSARETTVIRRNRFAGARVGKQVAPGRQFGIDLDDGSSNYEVSENLCIKMSIKTFCSEYCKFHDNVFVQARPLGLLQPFEGHFEIRDNHFVTDITAAEAEARFFKGVRFGVRDDFPAWLRDGRTLPGSLLAAAQEDAGPAVHADWSRPKAPEVIAQFRPEDISDFFHRLEFKGLALIDDRYHFWCTSPIWGTDGKVHLFASRWPVDTSKKKNDLWGLEEKCEIAHYVGEGPEGPFAFSDVALRGTGGENWDSRMAHNPDIKQVAGQYVLTYTSFTGEIGKRGRHYQIGMAVSENLYGPWKRIGRKGLVFGFDDGLGETNWDRDAFRMPNPYLVECPNGKLHLYYRSNALGREDIGVAVADAIAGPYVRHPVPLIRDAVSKEDPCVFIENGKFWLLYHPVTNKSKFAKCSPLHESDDGIRFSQEPKLAIPPLSYFCGTKADDETPYPSYFTPYRLDEPKLLLKDGKPTYLYLACGTNIKGGLGACNYVFKLHDARPGIMQPSRGK